MCTVCILPCLFLLSVPSNNLVFIVFLSYFLCDKLKHAYHIILIDRFHIPDLILELYAFIHFYMSYATGKMVPGLTRAMDRTTNPSIVFL